MEAAHLHMETSDPAALRDFRKMELEHDEKNIFPFARSYRGKCGGPTEWAAHAQWLTVDVF